MPTIKNLLFALLCCISQLSIAEVFVSSTLNTEAIKHYYVVRPGTYITVPLPGKGSPKDSFKITINAGNAIYKDITAYLVNQTNLRLFEQGYQYRGIGYQRAMAPFVVQGRLNTAEPNYLILDNRFAALISKKLDVTIEASLSVDEADRLKLQNVFSSAYTGLKQNLIFPDFNIHVEPCGQINAFSETFGSGDIHYCSELISNVFRTNNNGAFMAILLHEVGHSLLGLWGIPGNNNEDIADEFATYILMSGGPSGYALLDRSLEFWQNRDSTAEAMNMLKNGDRHSLSIQRIRNIKENMQRGVSFLKRWHRQIYPHSTTEALNRVVQNPQHGDDVDLAKTILAQRAKLAN